MPNDWFLKTPELFAAAAVGNSGRILTGAPPPAQAIPPVPLAPGDCQQFAFPGNVELRHSIGAIFTFFSTATTVNAPFTAKLVDKPETQQGVVTGSVDANRHVQLTISIPDNGSTTLEGEVGSDSKARSSKPRRLMGNPRADALRQGSAQAGADDLVRPDPRRSGRTHHRPQRRDLPV